jgi:ureidoglycolate lyase
MMHVELIARPLSTKEFAPFGEVLEAPLEPGRTFFNSSLGSLRAGASPNLRIVNKLPSVMPIKANLLERHQFSSQTFLPLDVGRMLIVVAPHAANGGPDVELAQAFLASSRQGVTYRLDTWHHGLTVLDKPAQLAVFMWCDGTANDEQFVSVPEFSIREP